MNSRIGRWSAGCATIAVLFGSSACAIGPKYQRPETPTPPAFRETLPPGWTDAQPSDSAPRGAWWRVFNNPDLDALEEQVAFSNQNVLAAEAQFREARAAVRLAGAGRFPTLIVTPSATTSGTGTASSGQPKYDIPLEATYQADVWGSIRRTVAGNAALAQASAAELESARLLYQAELATDYFQIQGLDVERQVLDATVKSYEQYLQLTRDRYEGGVASMADVDLAQTQLETARAQLADVEIPRTQFEHAVAVLTGKPPADLSMPSQTNLSSPPVISVGLSSTLLERRPDIAAAERQVAAANQQIGVAQAAFYPALSFSGSASSQAGAIVDLLTVPTRLWSVGAQLAETLFDGGKRRAQVKLTEAAYDATVANYRQTVLTGFQQVEDSLAALRILSQEAAIDDQAVTAAQESLDLSTVQYRGGLTSYLQVINAQSSLLQNQRARVDTQTRSLVASVSLIEALGGGWDASQLPSAQDVRR
jgi:NodT family efflux transporter outer membrane factor (OMF) lipoprotein